MTKKKLISIFAAVAAAAMLTACSSDGKSEQTTAETTTQTTIETTAQETTADENTDVPADTEADEGLTEDAEELNPLMPLVDATVSAGEWPALMEVTDSTMISDYFLIDTTDANYTGYIFMQCPMSANLTELIILKADDTEAAKAALEARKEKAQTIDAWYPNDVERAGSSIVGESNGYAYFIMTESPAEAEAALVAAIEAL